MGKSNRQEFTLLRTNYHNRFTMGLFVMPNGQILYSLELPWKDNAFRRSCIPANTYLAEPYPSRKFGLVYILLGTEPRTGILIHVANKPQDILGCIGLGTSARPGWISNSRKAINRFHEVAQMKPIIIHIIDWGKEHVSTKS